MMWLVWLLVSLASLTFALITLFVVVMHAEYVVKKRNLTLTWMWKIYFYPMALIGLVLDVTFNWTIGWVMYWEFPKEFMFTHRCYRHKRGDVGWRKELAWWWCKQLNQIDEGHC